MQILHQTDFSENAALERRGISQDANKSEIKSRISIKAEANTECFSVNFSLLL